MNAKTDFLSDGKAFSKRAALLLILVLASTLVWAGDKPWKAKPYPQWDGKELEAILTDSPWVRITPIQRSWQPAAEPGLTSGLKQTAANQSRSTPAAGAATTATAPDGAGGDTRQLNVQIYWQSSRVMRAATARQAVLHGRQVDVDKYASEPQAEYQIVLRIEDMTPFRQHDEKFFEGSAFLQTKKGKEKISPTHVVYEKNAAGWVEDAIFFFPKTTSSGAPTISADETDVQFSCKIADSAVRVDFKPREMVDQSGPAL